MNNIFQFDDLVRGKWQKAMDDGHFRYQLSILQNRILPGEKKFIAQVLYNLPTWTSLAMSTYTESLLVTY